MHYLVSILKCWHIYKQYKNLIALRISNFKGINEKIILLFNEYKIEGIKYLDFVDFFEVAKLINDKAHITLEGLEKI